MEKTNSYKLIGLKKILMTEGKNAGKTASTYYMSKPFTNYELDNSVCFGTSVTTEFSYTEFPVSVGDLITPIYEKGFQDKAILVNIVPFASGK